MSTDEISLPSQQQRPIHWHPSTEHPVQTQHLPPDDTSGLVVFTRQLWQRTMPDESQSEQGVLNKSHTANTQASQNNSTALSRRTSSTVSTRSQLHSPSPSNASKTPLTPEESPPFRTTRKRSAGIVDQEDKAVQHHDSTSRVRINDETPVHVCICQPDPKIPRPRNAFILYRQHRQSNVVAQNPGLANPEISKIIGEQWQNLPSDEKNRWKALAEEEKLRHQQQYPTYRYQPKRNGRGSSDAHAKCQKCGGRTILTPSAPYAIQQSSPAPRTPGSAITPVARTLPVLKDLSIQSPGLRQMTRPPHNMSPNHQQQHPHPDERDEIGPLSLENKRRKYNGDHPPTVQRVMPPRYGSVPGPMPGPGTPFPFGQSPAPQHPYPPGAAQARRESLPGMRTVMSPGPMAPPPRPGRGYQAHRLSQGYQLQDRSLTLPPLQTAGSAPGTAALSSSKSVEEQIMGISFRYKIKVLSQVAPPASRMHPRGPLIAVEGDNADAVKELTEWLKATLSKGDDLTVNLFDGPNVPTCEGKEESMAVYHRLAADWLGKNKDILNSIAMQEPPAAKEKEGGDDAKMTDALLAAAAADERASCSPKVMNEARKIDENYDDDNDERSSSSPPNNDKRDPSEQANTLSESTSESAPIEPAETMDIDQESKRPSRNTSLSTSSNKVGFCNNVKPVTLIPNFSLYTSNRFAKIIPLNPDDKYAPSDHWSWNATILRGIIGPDLTIYVRDSVPDVNGAGVDMEAVEGRQDVSLFVVRRRKTEAGAEIEAAVLRRVGFEVSEWVRAFGKE